MRKITQATQCPVTYNTLLLNTQKLVLVVHDFRSPQDRLFREKQDKHEVDVIPNKFIFFVISSTVQSKNGIIRTRRRVSWKNRPLDFHERNTKGTAGLLQSLDNGLVGLYADLSLGPRRLVRYAHQIRLGLLQVGLGSTDVQLVQRNSLLRQQLH